jgi:molybdopterin-guanine dinucleotide biosynthesis protein A
MTSAAILTGGRARRFDGRDKSQLRVAGRTILERQLEALHGAVGRIWLAGYHGTAPLAPPLYALADRKPDHGPLAGLDAALAAEPHGPVLLLACDMPNVTAPFLAHLLGQLDGVDAVVPKTERGYHPLCAVYAQSSRAAVQRRLDQGHLRMQELLADLRIRTVEGPELASFGEPDSLLANVNTQAALDALESQQNH